LPEIVHPTGVKASSVVFSRLAAYLKISANFQPRTIVEKPAVRTICNQIG
jgi:hypothetical protein